MVRKLSIVIAFVLVATSCKIDTVVGGGNQGSVVDGMVGTDLNLGSPVAVAMDGHPAGGVAFLRGDEVVRLQPDGTLAVVDTIPLTGNQFLTDLAVADDGTVYVTRTEVLGPSDLAIVTPEDGTSFVDFEEVLVGVAVDDMTGDVYVAVDTDFDFTADILKVDGGLLVPVPGGPQVFLNFGIPAGYLSFDVDDGAVFVPTATRVVRFAPDGTMTVMAGNGSSGFSGDGGPAVAAELSGPTAVDAFDGELYIADTGNHRIRMVAVDETIDTVAGNGFAAFSGDGGEATDATLRGPRDVSAWGLGRMYVYDTGNERIRVVNGAPGIPCNQFHFYGVRGSGATSEDGDGYGDVVNAVRTQLSANQIGRSVGYTPLDYTAAPVEVIPVDADLFFDSASQGADLLLLELRDRLEECPDTRLVLSGHSQGSMVIREALVQMTLDERDAVAFVALWSDPYRDSESPYTGGDDTDDDGVFTALVGAFPEIDSSMWDRTVSWCEPFDIVCGYSSGKVPGFLLDSQGIHSDAYLNIASLAGSVLWGIIDSPAGTSAPAADQLVQAQTLPVPPALEEAVAPSGFLAHSD